MENDRKNTAVSDLFSFQYLINIRVYLGGIERQSNPCRFPKSVFKLQYSQYWTFTQYIVSPDNEEFCDDYKVSLRNLSIMDFALEKVQATIFSLHIYRSDTQKSIQASLQMRFRVCNKTCLVGLLIRSILRQKKCTSASVRCSISSKKLNEFTDQQDMFCFNHASALYMSSNIVKNVDK